MRSLSLAGVEGLQLIAARLEYFIVINASEQKNVLNWPASLGGGGREGGGEALWELCPSL